MTDFLNDIDFDEITLSAHRLAGVVHKTPIQTSSRLNALLGCELFCKAEHLQKTGAFKYRGASNALLQLTPDIQSVATHSSGNHGAAIAAAASLQGKAAHIVMPDISVQAKIDAVRAYGGEVHFCAPTQQARETALELLVDKGMHPVPPYDDWRIIYGQSTAATELLHQVTDLDIILAPVGGGGLISGTCLAVEAYDPSIAVIGAEPAGADDVWQSLQAGQRITDIKPDTIADGLRATVGQRNFAVIQEYLDELVVIDDRQIMAALQLVWQSMKQLIEPSCATVIAAIQKQPELFSGKRVGVILSGGNVDTSTLIGALQQD